MRNISPDLVNSRADLVQYVQQLSNIVKSESCENNSTAAYLEAFSAWTEDMDSFFLLHSKNIDEVSKWSLIAHMVTAALHYE
jgi:hypothetical protein